MVQIGAAIKPGISSARDLLEQILNWCGTKGHVLSIEQSSARDIPGLKIPQLPVHELVQSSDWVISIGGDGTLIWLARHAREDGPLFIGVHFGTFGFLTDVKSTELLTTLDSIDGGITAAEERGTLLVRVMREGAEILGSPAVNDAVIQRGSRGRILDIDLTVNGEAVTRLRGDGLILATPSGSTAYSLSAGGPIVHPTLPAVLITPICAHSLTNRPLIMGIESEIRVTVPAYEGRVFLTIDGQESLQLKSGDEVLVSEGSCRIRFIRDPSLSYYDILRTKLNWRLSTI